MNVDILAKRIFQTVQRTKLKASRVKWEKTNDTTKKEATAVARFVLRNFNSK